MQANYFFNLGADAIDKIRLLYIFYIQFGPVEYKANLH